MLRLARARHRAVVRRQRPVGAGPRVLRRRRCSGRSSPRRSPRSCLRVAGARTRGRPRPPRSRWHGGSASGFAAGTSGAAFGIGAALALAALTVCFARAIARRGVFGGDPTVATIVVVIAALLLLFIFYPVGKSLLAAGPRHEGKFRARARRRAPVHRRHLVASTASRRHALRRRDQFGAARVDRRRAVDAARPRAGARRAARRPALLGPPQGDVDPADHHAAVRDRAGAGRAVRAHGAHHRLARARVRHPAHALDLRPARRDAGAAAVVLADRVHDPARRAGRGESRRSKKRRRRCARREGACSAR